MTVFFLFTFILAQYYFKFYSNVKFLQKVSFKETFGFLTFFSEIIKLDILNEKEIRHAVY